MSNSTGHSPQLVEARSAGRWTDYLAIMRLDHSTKHVFIVPGIALAWLLRGIQNQGWFADVALGLVAAVSIASANYVINEWLDREFDQFHPTKSQRSAVQRALKGELIFLQWLALTCVGLGCAFASSPVMFAVALIFGLQGIVYNVEPLRSKDKPFLDVISESINNPLRLMIGWAMVDATTLPPSSLILSYWFGGAFLMAAKRLSEYREIVASHGKELLSRYRASFEGYTEVSLSVSCNVYSTLSSFFLAVFLIKYRIEYILLLPFVTALFGYYLHLAMKPGSAAQTPEKLVNERSLWILVAALACTAAVTTFVDIPLVDALAGQQYIEVMDR